MRFRPSILLLFPAALLFFCAAFRLPAPSRPAPEYGSAVCNTVRAMLQDDTQEAVPPRMQPGRAEAGRRGGTPIPPALLPPVPVPLPRAEAVPTGNGVPVHAVHARQCAARHMRVRAGPAQQ